MFSKALIQHSESEIIILMSSHRRESRLWVENPASLCAQSRARCYSVGVPECASEALLIAVLTTQRFSCQPEFAFERLFQTVGWLIFIFTQNQHIQSPLPELHS